LDERKASLRFSHSNSDDNRLDAMPLVLSNGTGNGRGVRHGDNSRVKVLQVAFDTDRQRLCSAVHNNLSRLRAFP